MRCVWDAKVRGSNPRTPTNLKLLPVELALGLRNRVANVRFIPRVPLYGVCSIMVVPKFVELESVGSIPIIHPKLNEGYYIMNKLEELQKKRDESLKAYQDAYKRIDVDGMNDTELSLAFETYNTLVQDAYAARTELEDHTHAVNNTTPWKADRRIRDKTINRFELIDETGRVIVKYGVSVELLYQDDGRTLKVVLKDMKS